MIFGVSRTSATKQMIFFSSVLWVVPFARRTRRQMAHVAPGEKEPIARFIEKNIQSRIDELESPRRFERYGKGVAKKAADDAAVGDHDDLLALMFAGKLVQASHVSVDLLANALAARDHVIGSQSAMQFIFVRMLRFNFLAAESLENS